MPGYLTILNKFMPELIQGDKNPTLPYGGMNHFRELARNEIRFYREIAKVTELSEDEIEKL